MLSGLLNKVKNIIVGRGSERSVKPSAHAHLPSAVRTHAALMDKIYEGLSGFGIPKEEEDKIRSCESAPTYGEILYESYLEILNYLNLGPEDVLCDLGSGVGKVVMQTALDSRVGKCVGIELSASRSASAGKALERLKTLEPHAASRCQFVEEDFLKADLAGVTAIYMCSTCYPLELMQQLVDKFLELKPGLRVISLKALPQNPRLEMVKQFSLKMTWSANSAVYVYELR